MLAVEKNKTKQNKKIKDKKRVEKETKVKVATTGNNRNLVNLDGAVQYTGITCDILVIVVHLQCVFIEMSLKIIATWQMFN